MKSRDTRRVLMANQSPLKRKQQVLKHLKDRANRWVNGPEIANERVGGSEGHRRFRELRDEGHPVEDRRHPDPNRDIWQYRYVQAIPVWNPTQDDLEETQTIADDWVSAMTEQEDKP
jgi:hypothetical protein